MPANTERDATRVATTLEKLRKNTNVSTSALLQALPSLGFKVETLPLTLASVRYGYHDGRISATPEKKAKAAALEALPKIYFKSRPDGLRIPQERVKKGQRFLNRIAVRTLKKGGDVSIREVLFYEVRPGLAITRNGAKIYAAPAGAKDRSIEGKPPLFFHSQYDIKDALRSAGIDLTVLAARALGKPTKGEERVKTKARSRAIAMAKKAEKATTGTCQVCFGVFETRKGRMVLHGFERPGIGYTVGRCPGVGHLPYAASNQALRTSVNMTKEAKRAQANRESMLRKNLEDLVFGHTTKLPYRAPGEKAPTMIGPTHPHWASAHEQRVLSLNSEIRDAESLQAFYTGKIKAYKPNPGS